MLIHDRLVQLVERIPIHDSRIRRGEPGGVHKMRVTLRRTRSLLATFGPLFEAEVVTSLREELKWVAGECGDARDSEVVRTRMKLLATTPEEQALTTRIAGQLEGGTAEAVARSIAALDSERYSSLLRELHSLAIDPPWNPDVDTPLDDLVRQRVLRDWERLRRRAKGAKQTTTVAEHEAALHEVRKAAKRLRYSAETLIPAYDEDAKRLTRGARRIQTELGEVQDSALSRGVLRTMATAEGTPPDEAFVLGGLHAQDRLRSASAGARYTKAWTMVARKRNRRWLI